MYIKINVFNTLLSTVKGKENKQSLKKTEEGNLEETESKGENEEVPTEEAKAESVRALKERYGDQYLAVGRR
jgi:hypothetical protein